MGWLPSAPQLETNPLEVSKRAAAAGLEAKDYVAKALKSGELQAVLRRPGQSGELAAQHVRLALQPAGRVGQGPRIFPQASARHQARRHGQGPRRGRQEEAVRGRLARRGAGRKARPAGHARLPHVDDLHVLRHRAADRDLVREERPQHLRHASLHPSADRGGRSGVGGAQRLGDLQGHRQGVLGGRAGSARRREGRGADPDHARHARRDRAAVRREGLEEGRDRSDPRQDHAVGHRGRARLSQPLQALHLARTADGQARQWRQGHELEYRARGRVPQEAQRRGDGGGGDQRPRPDRHRHRRLRSHPQSGAGNQRRGRGQGLGLAAKASPGASTPISPSRRRTRRSASATSSRSRARSSRRRSGRAWSRRRSATTPATPTCTS